MSEPFLAEIKMVGFNFAPRGWSFCDGQILPINQNQSLYSLLGTTYGGDGRTSFALPDLRGRVPIHVGGGHNLGTKSGEDLHTLTINEMPNHNHGPLQATNTDATDTKPEGNVLARTVALAYEASAATIGPNIQDTTVTHVGDGNGHNNLMPYQTLSFCIALRGLFPSRN